MTDAAQQHLDRRRIWERKYAIRACYKGWYDRLRPYIVPGRSFEVGAGSADMPSLWPGLLTSDVVATPFIDLVADAMRLPLADASFSNLLVIDLIHHLADPHRFFTEAERVLRPGGRLLAIEPYITPVSWLGYRLLHHEDIWFGGYQKSRDKSDPWEGNLAVPNLIFSRERAYWQEIHPNLRIIRLQQFGLLDFQLAGGFKSWTLLPSPRLYDAALRLDRTLDLLGQWLGFRILVVIERVI